MPRERVVIAGGGVGGLAAALAFARTGHPVTVLERDVVPASATPSEAFAATRRGAPQAHQTHGFLARIVVLLRERFPDVLEQLRAAGVSTMSGTANMGEPQPGDEDLKVMIVRRTTFEWVLRRAAAAESLVELRPGVGCAGLHVGAGGGAVPQVDGVVLEDGSTVSGDIVVASTGRRGDVPGWLREHGVIVPETIHESGLMYLTRWYRLPTASDIVIDPKLGGDLGFVKYLAVPGDESTLSVTLAIRPDDKELRAALSDPAGFERACRALPGPDRFFGGPPLEPLGGVRPMTGLINRLRSFTDEAGDPTVLGFHAVGDAHTCTNPLYGRGCSLAMVQAVMLADAAAAHPGDPTARARAYEAGCRTEVQPWWEVSVQMDKAGADPAFAGDGRPSNAQRGLAAVFVAAATDPVIGRAMARFWNLLARPDELMANPELMGRMAAVMADPDAYPVPESEGPSRQGLLDALAA